ncbi:unnamed protein product [Rotaria magnacalcarata]|uniref:Uncharacterized protein n=1 Tax=Rotaria magnacalcarata TaxID=392030 RepID=A0A8S3ET13_9BILA|nr:unnamed protein product [Rotaria magnacalcarata]
MAGNPSCLNKIEERNKRNEELKLKNAHLKFQQQQQKSLPSVWTEKSRYLNEARYSYDEEIDQIRDFVFDTISPYLRELGDSFLIKCKTAEKDRLRTLHTSFKEKLEDHNKTIVVVAQSNAASNTTLNELND